MDDNDYGALYCTNCKKYTVCYEDDSKEYYDEISDFCDCDIEKIFIKGNDMQDPIFFLTCLGMDLESANHHSMTNLPDEIYNEIVKKLKLRKNKRLELVKILYDCFYKNI